MIAAKEKLSFIEQVSKRSSNECIVWPWGTNNGYGYVMIDSKITYSHRIVLMLSKGDPPEDKPFAIHSCHNRKCCNPRHLRWGDYKDNKQDDILIGNYAHGKKHGRAKVTERDVKEIRKRAKKGESKKSLGRYFGVSDVAIGFIVSKKHWRHIK